MQTAIYILYGLLLTAFLIFAGFAVHHAFSYSYISPRIRVIAWIFIIVSIALIAISAYFLTQLSI
ncbi:MAG: hypothetical protein V1936_04305 [Patescibacteria group bacterium]